MTGYEIYRQAESLLGYSDTHRICEQDEVTTCGIDQINCILADLHCQTIPALVTELELSAPIKEALLCGTAALIALSDGDFEKNRTWATVYQSKRAAALAGIGTISDVLPAPGEG